MAAARPGPVGNVRDGLGQGEGVLGLTIDVAEKAALEAMLASSPTSPTTSQADGPVPPPPPTASVAAPATTTSSPSSTSVYYPSCAAARAAGAAPLQRGGPGYRDALDAKSERCRMQLNIEAPS